MGVVKALETLDEKILSCFQKITEKAHKVNRTKYDLAQYCDSVASAAMTGVGVYGFILGTMTGNGFQLGVGSLCAGMGYFAYRHNKKKNQREQDSELATLVQTGAPKSPRTSAFRPVLALIIGAGFGQTGWEIFTGNPLIPYEYAWISPDFSKVNKEDYHMAATHATFSLFTYYGCDLLASYFRETTMFPPSKSKVSLWKQALNYVKSKVTPTPELQPEKVNGQYQSLEDRI